MKLASRLLSLLVIAIGVYLLIPLTQENKKLSDEVRQLEAELGRLEIKNPDNIYVVAIESPRIPPEVAQHIGRVWQFRVFLPAGYEYSEFQGSGWIGDDFYHSGSSGSSWYQPQKEARHVLCTISMKSDGDRIVMHAEIAGSGSTVNLHSDIDNDAIESMQVELLAQPGDGAREFTGKTILPMIRMYDPDSKKSQRVGGRVITAYRGFQVVICPTALKSQFSELRRGKLPLEFDSEWIAKGILQADGVTSE